MSLVLDIATKLVALGLGTDGVDIFKGWLPATPDVCIAVYGTGGSAPEYGFGTPGVNYTTPGVQVVVRGAPEDYTGPEGRAETAFYGLAAVEAMTLAPSGDFYHWIHPIQGQPTVMTRDDRKRVLFVFNCLCEKEP